MSAELDDPMVCSECGSREMNRDSERGEVVCAICGVVISGLCLFHDGSQREPCGDGRLLTEISPSNRDHQGRPLPAKNQVQADRMRRWQRRMRTYKSAHRNAGNALKCLDRMCEVLDLPLSVKETCHRIYAEALNRGYTLGRPLDILSAAIVYSACRMNDIPRTLTEVSQTTGLDRRLIGRTQVRLVRELDLHLPLPRPDHFVERFCSHLKLSEATTKKAKEIVFKAQSVGMNSGKDPSGLAAAAIYLATTMTGQLRTQGEVEASTGITQVTIRKRCRELTSICGFA
jgi:transcription initiation factor TFIIB